MVTQQLTIISSEQLQQDVCCHQYRTLLTGLK
jgi:hypothetical protein